MKTEIIFPPGLQADDTTFMSEGAALDCSGLRCWEDGWQQMGGYESITFTLLGGVCRSVLQWTDNASPNGILNIAFGLHNGLTIYKGGDLVSITPAAFVAGNIDGSVGAGFGTGGYGLGPYGAPSTDPVYPLTWALSNYGETLIANARGQGIWQWSNNTAAIAVPVTNAPAVSVYATVVPQRQIVAFGCTNLAGSFDAMCIRGSDIENITSWTPTTANNAFENILDSGSRIVTARVIGDYLMVWTDLAFYLGTFIGAPDETWRFERQGMHCGAIGPNAVVIDGQLAKWVGPDGQFWAAPIGGQASPIPCAIQTDFAANLAPGQGEKLHGGTTARYREVRWWYADGRDGYEISRSVAVNDALEWSRDTSQPRTAYIDAGPSPAPVATTYAGNIYWQDTGNTGDGGQLSGFFESADFYLSEAEDLMQVNGFWPDFRAQSGTINLTIYTRLYPQDTAVRTRGPYAMTPNIRKRDFRATGRLARIRLDWAASPSAGRFGKFAVDIEPAGQR